ncbi:MAG: hypothetical protein E7330_07920 [Clostridiales bacterium]|nr:hypothetical protein [Clostridiales bacterium]
MKFRWIDKLLLVLVLFIIIALAALSIGVAMSLITAESIVMVVEILTNGLIENRLILGGIGLVLLVFAFRLFIAMGKRKAAKATPQAKPTSALIQAGDNGAASVSLQAVDAMVQRHCRANQKVKECESNIVVLETNAVAVGVKLVVANETVLPEFTNALQESLKTYIETYCGIVVRNVDVLIISAPQPQKPARVV